MIDVRPLTVTFDTLFANTYLDKLTKRNQMNSDCLEVDELILEIADYKNDYADMATEKLFRKCSTSWEAYQDPRDRVHDSCLPDSARQQLRRIIKKIQVRLIQSREYGWAYDGL